MPRETETEAEILNHIFDPLLPTGELSFDPGEEENVRKYFTVSFACVEIRLLEKATSFQCL